MVYDSLLRFQSSLTFEHLPYIYVVPKVTPEMGSDAQLRFQYISTLNLLQIHTVSKNDLKNGLGRLVKALELLISKFGSKSTQFSKMASEMVQDAQLRLQSIFFEIWLQIDLVSKKWHQNGLGRLVNAVEHFFEKLVPNLRSFQKWCQKCSRTLS